MPIDLAHFDETRYLPPRKFEADYRQRVAAGYAKMRTKRVVVAGLARNIEHVLPATRARIERLGSFFAQYQVLLYENDSSDRTPEILKDWSDSNSNVNIVSESLGDPVNRPERCLKRAERMARYRDRCQSEILERWPNYDYVILIDTDLVGGWSHDGIAHTFGHRTWDFVGAYGIVYKRLGLSLNCMAHYDAWAYRTNADFTPMTARSVNQIRFKRGEPLVPLYSCFGGLGVYRMQAFQHGIYDGDDTEHVGFHRSMRNNGFGQQFLNPSQLVVYGRKNRRWDPIVHRFRLALAKCGIQSKPQWMFSAFGPEFEMDQRIAETTDSIFSSSTKKAA